jgi:hypothetical protein
LPGIASGIKKLTESRRFIFKNFLFCSPALPAAFSYGARRVASQKSSRY